MANFDPLWFENLWTDFSEATLCNYVLDVTQWCSWGIFFKAEAGAEAVKAGNESRLGQRQSPWGWGWGKADGDRGKAEAVTPRSRQGRWISRQRQSRRGQGKAHRDWGLKTETQVKHLLRTFASSTKTIIIEYWRQSRHPIAFPFVLYHIVHYGRRQIQLTLAMLIEEEATLRCQLRDRADAEPQITSRSRDRCTWLETEAVGWWGRAETEAGKTLPSGKAAALRTTSLVRPHMQIHVALWKREWSLKKTLHLSHVLDS